MIQTVRGCAGPIEFRNVMAILPGKTARRIYVSGHYDSVNLGAGGQQTSNAGGEVGACLKRSAGRQGGRADPARRGPRRPAPAPRSTPAPGTQADTRSEHARARRE